MCSEEDAVEINDKQIFTVCYQGEEGGREEGKGSKFKAFLLKHLILFPLPLHQLEKEE